MYTLAFLSQMEAPVARPVAVLAQRSKLEHCLGTLRAPPGAGHLDAVLHQVLYRHAPSITPVPTGRPFAKAFG